MTIKKKLLVCLITLIGFSASVIYGAVYAALIYFDRFGHPKIHDLYVDRVLMFFLAALLIVFILMMVAMWVIGFILIRSILSPLNKLYRLANEIKKGNLDCEVDYYKKDEFGRVFSEFNEMRLRLKDSLERITEQEDMRKNMVISIAHDIKTPVTAICGHAEGLLDGIAATPDKRDKYLKTILEKSRVVDKLVSDLFTFSQLDFGKLQFRMTVVDTKEYISGVYAELSLGQSDFFVEYDLDATLKISVDPFQLKRVFQNISQNSVKYCVDGKTHIKISLHENAGNAVIKISDSGIGISSDDCERIFDRFYRADRSRGTKGSGLGLSISRQIIEAMNGKIWARPNVPSGLSVYISFPAYTEVEPKDFV